MAFLLAVLRPFSWTDPDQEAVELFKDKFISAAMHFIWEWYKIFTLHGLFGLVIVCIL
jgi:hypothetical protein